MLMLKLNGNSACLLGICILPIVLRPAYFML